MTTMNLTTTELMGLICPGLSLDDIAEVLWADNGGIPSKWAEQPAAIKSFFYERARKLPRTLMALHVAGINKELEAEVGQ